MSGGSKSGWSRSGVGASTPVSWTVAWLSTAGEEVVSSLQASRESVAARVAAKTQVLEFMEFL